jgi:hypothetical protein
MIELDCCSISRARSSTIPDASPGIASPVPRAGLVLSGGPGNGSYRPTLDPLTATDAGATATINIASHPIQFQGITTNPSYSAATITGLPFGTLEFIYENDPDRTGGTVPVGNETVKEDVLKKAGALFIGSINTPNDGGSDTVGNGDGGASAQIGRFITVLPATYVEGGSPAWTTPGNSIDTDLNTFADVTTAGIAATLEIYNFPTIFSGFGNLNLKIRHQFISVTTGKTGLVEYSLDNGASWSSARAGVTVPDGAIVTTPVSLSINQNPTLVRARFTVPASNDSSAPRNAGTGADDATVGTVAWSTPTNAQGAVNSTYAQASNSTAGTSPQSHYLKLTNFGFSLPVGATIVGIKVAFAGAAMDSGSPDDATQKQTTDTVVKLVKGGVVSGTNKARADATWATVAFGGDADLWGLALTKADVEAANFGVVISVTLFKDSSALGSAVAKVDAVEITVYYGTGGGATELKVYSVKLEATL